MGNHFLNKILTSPETLARILDNLKEGIIAHDLDRRIYFFNRAAENITGYSRKEILGRDCHEAFGAPFCGNRCSFCSDIPSMNEHKAYPLPITTADGEPRRIEMSITRMNDTDGRFVGVLASFQDVTELFDRKPGFGKIVGRDVKMHHVFRQITDVADYDFPVHVHGETGTGKELVAAAVHSESSRGEGPFVPINCGALPESLIESELFGHVKGAFSGAIRDKKGRFELADGGTVFLDEIAELSNHMQVRLLRFLQEGEFERVGGERTVSVDARVISATNRDLKTEVGKGRFREDLFYRLNVIPIQIPPLRERKNDIPLLVDHFLKEAYERYRKKTPRVSREALARLMDYRWPGNVRELQNAIQFAIVRSSGTVITPDDLPMELREDACISAGRGATRKLEREAVQEALAQTAGNKSRAAKLLGVGRATLYRFLRDYPDLI